MQGAIFSTLFLFIYHSIAFACLFNLAPILLVYIRLDKSNMVQPVH